MVRMIAPILAIDAAAAAVTWCVLLALGARLRRILRLPMGGTLRWSVDLALGGWASALVLLALGLAGLTGWWWQLGALAVLGGLGRWRARRPAAPLVAAAIGGLIFLPVAMGPPFFYDAWVYHLGLPWQAMLEDGWQGHPENLFSTFPPLTQLLYLPLLSVDLLRAPAVLHWLAWVTAASSVHALARRIGAPHVTACLAAAAAAVAPATVLVAGFPAAEAWLLVGLLPALALATGTCRRSSWALAGLLAGAATAARMQGLPWSVMIFAMIGFRCRKRAREVAIALACWLAGALPWWGKNLVLLGDPTAPLFWDRAGMETLWRDSQALLREGAALSEIMAALPRLLAPQLPWLLPLALLTLVAVLRRRALLPGLAAVFGLFAWVATGALPRFLAPTAWLLLAVAAAAAARGRLPRRLTAAVLLWCTLLGIAVGVTSVRGVLPPGHLGLDTDAASALLSVHDPLPAFRAAELLPAEARVLFVAEPRGFLFPRPFIAPSQHDPNLLRGNLEAAAALDDVVDGLAAAGITHLLVNEGELGQLAERYPVAPWTTPRGRQRWNGLLARLGEPVVSVGSVRIFALPPS